MVDEKKCLDIDEVRVCKRDLLCLLKESYTIVTMRRASIQRAFEFTDSYGWVQSAGCSVVRAGKKTRVSVYR